MESIGFFQLESLILARSPFLFFDLGCGEDCPPVIARYVKHAEKIRAEDIAKRVSGEDKSRPILLISREERPSLEAARGLETAGFNNVYIIAGGVEGLVSELA